MRSGIIIFTISLAIFACKKNKIDIDSFWQCHNSMHLDSVSISNKLVGSWKWEKQSCFWSGKTTMADKAVIATFNSNGTFAVSENAVTVAQGNWRLKIVDSNMWGLDLSSPSAYLYGIILFCDNEILFNDSYVDGCDNLFKK